jgi:hypothetical protein
MGRKNVIVPYKIIDDGNMGADITSVTTDVQYQDNIGIIVAWTGASPVGQLKVEVANEVANDPDTIVWDALDFGSTINVAGNSGKHSLNIQSLPYTKIRLKYLRTSGTGQMNAILTSKVVGA